MKKALAVLLSALLAAAAAGCGATAEPGMIPYTGTPAEMQALPEIESAPVGTSAPATAAPAPAEVSVRPAD